MKRGFTLVEILIYTALLGVIMSAVVLVSHAMLQARAKTRAGLILEENLRYALTRIVGRVHDMSEIVLPLTGTDDTLVLATTDPGELPTTIALENGLITIAGGIGATLSLAGAPLPLTSAEVEVTTLSFMRLSAIPGAVRVSITGRLRDAMGAYQSTLTVLDTAVIRR